MSHRYVITGGTGLIGTPLVRHLLAQGHHVQVLSRRARPSDHPNLAYVKWDGRRIPLDTPADVVINLAGSGIIDKRWTSSYKEEIRRSRFNATQACVDYLTGAASGAQAFLSGSAVGYYGTHPAGHVLDEAAPAGRDFLGQTSKEWERLAVQGTKGTGIRTCTLRTGVVLAPEGGAFPKLLAPFKLYAGGYLGNGQQPFPWIHLRDVVGAISYLANTPSCEGAFNLTAPTPMTNKGFSQLLGKLIGKPAGIPVPSLAVKTLLGESSVILLEGQEAHPTRLQQVGYSFLFPDPEAALRDLLAAVGEEVKA